MLKRRLLSLLLAMALMLGSLPLGVLAESADLIPAETAGTQVPAEEETLPAETETIPEETETVPEETEAELPLPCTAWSFEDPDGILEDGALQLLGTASFETVISMLPVRLLLEDGTSAEILRWECPQYAADPEGNWPESGSFSFIPVLSQDILFSEEAPARVLTVIAAATPQEVPEEETQALTEEALLSQEDLYQNDRVLQENGNTIQHYYSDRDGTMHTVYWAKGVTPPLMTSDPALQGTDGYFEKDMTVTPKITNITYQYPVETGRGYYDLNKSIDRENSMCYLASASNLLYWWMDQNASNIAAYREKLADGTFRQTPGLTDLEAADWDKILTAPGMGTANGLSMPLMRDSYLMHTAFQNNFYSRLHDGYWEAAVFDFFLNGYWPIWPEGDQGILRPNTPDTYKPHSSGGYFFPVFGREPLTSFYRQTQYDFYNSRFRSWILGGTGISIGYILLGNNAHALSVWGAEYDAQGNLCRIFVTDSNDAFSGTYADPGRPKGLHGINVKNIDGLLHIGNNEGPAAGNGNIFTCVSTLDLGYDRWNAALNDPEPRPHAPVIRTQPQGRSYAAGSTPEPLTLKAELDPRDAGKGSYLRYQWYEAENASGDNPVLIEKAQDSSYTPSLEGAETRFYFCRVTASKYGHETSLDSDTAAIALSQEPVVNAAKPRLYFDAAKKYVPQGSKITLEIVIKNEEELQDVSFQWYRARMNSQYNYDMPIAGANSRTLVVDAPEEGYGSFYFCRVTNRDTRPEVNGASASYTDSKICYLFGTAPLTADVTSLSMSLKADIAMNFLIPEDQVDPVQAAADGYTLRLTHTYADGRPQQVKLIKSSSWTLEAGYYQAALEGIAAKEMTDILEAQVVNADGSPAGKALTASVRDYLMRIYRFGTLEEQELAIALMNYGARAQKLFSYHEEDPANRDISEYEQQVKAASDYFKDYAYAPVLYQPGIRLYSGSLQLESALGLNLYFQLSGNRTADSFRFQLIKDGQPAGDLLPQERDGLLLLNFSPIYASALGQNYTVRVSDSLTGEARDYSFGPFTYCRMVSGDPALQELALSLADLHKNALAYLGK